MGPIAVGVRRYCCRRDADGGRWIDGLDAPRAVATRQGANHQDRNVTELQAGPVNIRTRQCLSWSPATGNGPLTRNSGYSSIPLENRGYSFQLNVGEAEKGGPIFDNRWPARERILDQ